MPILLRAEVALGFLGLTALRTDRPPARDDFHAPEAARRVRVGEDLLDLLGELVVLVLGEGGRREERDDKEKDEKQDVLPRLH